MEVAERAERHARRAARIALAPALVALALLSGCLGPGSCWRDDGHEMTLAWREPGLHDRAREAAEGGNVEVKWMTADRHAIFPAPTLPFNETSAVEAWGPEGFLLDHVDWTTTAPSGRTYRYMLSASYDGKAQVWVELRSLGGAKPPPDLGELLQGLDTFLAATTALGPEDRASVVETFGPAGYGESAGGEPWLTRVRDLEAPYRLEELHRELAAQGIEDRGYVEEGHDYWEFGPYVQAFGDWRFAFRLGRVVLAAPEGGELTVDASDDAHFQLAGQRQGHAAMRHLARDALEDLGIAGLGKDVDTRYFRECTGF